MHNLPEPIGEGDLVGWTVNTEPNRAHSDWEIALTLATCSRSCSLLVSRCTKENKSRKTAEKFIFGGALCGPVKKEKRLSRAHTRNYLCNSNEIMCHRWQASIEIQPAKRTRAPVADWNKWGGGRVERRRVRESGNGRNRNEDETLTHFISFSSLAVRGWRARDATNTSIVW